MTTRRAAVNYKNLICKRKHSRQCYLAKRIEYVENEPTHRTCSLCLPPPANDKTPAEGICRSNNSIIMIIDRLYIALFADLTQTHCAHIARDSDSETESFYRTLFNIHRRGVPSALFGCCNLFIQ